MRDLNSMLGLLAQRDPPRPYVSVRPVPPPMTVRTMLAEGLLPAEFAGGVFDAPKR
jgi:hypothetical protein